MRSYLVLPALFSALALGACTPPPKTRLNVPQYWQRVSASESAYLQGPKAQQMLKRDISRCVVELRELEHLGAVRDPIPSNPQGRVLDPDQLEAYKQAMPERDGHLFAEYSDYQDFEGCMLANGWERTLYVPYDTMERSREDYLDSHIDYWNRDRMKKTTRRTQESGGSYNN